MRLSASEERELWNQGCSIYHYLVGKGLTDSEAMARSEQWRNERRAFILAELAEFEKEEAGHARSV